MVHKMKIRLPMNSREMALCLSCMPTSSPLTKGWMDMEPRQCGLVGINSFLVVVAESGFVANLP